MCCVIADHQPSCRDLLGAFRETNINKTISDLVISSLLTRVMPHKFDPQQRPISHSKHAVAKFSDKNNFFLAKDSNLLGNYHVSTFPHIDAACGVSAHWCHAWSMTLLVLLGRAAIDHFNGNRRENYGRNLSNCATNKSFIAPAADSRTSSERDKRFFF